MHIALAPFQLRAGVTEDALRTASDRFDEEFVSKQEGIVRRILVKDVEDGSYADLVFFRDLASIGRVVEAEKSSEAVATFFSTMAEGGGHRVYEVLKAYE